MKPFFFTPVVAFLLLATSCLGAQPDTSMTNWNYAYDVHYADLDKGVRLAYVDEGEGAETLVFIHGLGSNLQAWNKTIAGLHKSYRCIALDLPGYGKSSQEDYPFGMSFFADNVAAFVTALGLENVTLVGHSMGGQVALTLALRQPSYLQNLVLAAPAGLETFTAENHAFFATYFTPEIIRGASEEQIKANFHLNFYAMPADAQFMIDDRMKLRKDTQAYHYYSELVPQSVQSMLNEPVAAHLEEIKVPTLVVFGLQDKLIPNKFLHPTLTVETVAQVAEEKIPNAEIRLLNEAGHFVQWDQYEAFNQAVREFLSR